MKLTSETAHFSTVCGATGKRAYLRRGKAKKVMKHMKSSRKITSMRVYRCWWCDFWHLTHDPRASVALLEGQT